MSESDLNEAVESDKLDLNDVTSMASRRLAEPVPKIIVELPNVRKWRTLWLLFGRKTGTLDTSEAGKPTGTNNRVKTMAIESAVKMAGRIAAVHRRKSEMLPSSASSDDNKNTTRCAVRSDTLL